MGFEEMGRGELEQALKERGIVVEHGSGAGGNVLVADLRAALEAHSSETVAPELDPSARIWPAVCRRAWKGNTIGATVLVTKAQRDYFTTRTRPPHLESLGDPILEEEPEESEEPETLD